MEFCGRPAVLLVEDEFLVLLAARDFLAEAGFLVLDAENADGALALLDDHPETGLVFTDINMPGSMDGVGLAHVVSRRRPDVHVVLTSGRAAPAAADMPLGARFVEKPYGMGDISEMFKTLLASGGDRLLL
jgi:DNA-binding NtrC family response regulator